MWLALIRAAFAQTDPSLEVGVGASELIVNRGQADPRVVVRGLRGPIALELSGTFSPWAYEPDSMNAVIYQLLPEGEDWFDHQRHAQVQLLADVGVPTLTERFGGSPHLYAGAEALRYTPRSMAVYQGDANLIRPEQPLWALSPVVGAGVQAYLGAFSLRFSVCSTWEPSSFGGRAFTSRGSWDLLYRF